jgi:hypothetical protein
MASMGDVPNATWDIVPMGSWHRRRGLLKDIKFADMPNTPQGGISTLQIVFLQKNKKTICKVLNCLTITE